MKYNKYKFSEVCSFIDYRGKTPPKTKVGIPLVTAKIVKNGTIQKPQEFIAEDYYDKWMTRGIPKKGSVVFTTEAPLGEVAIIKTDEKLAFAQRIIIFEPNEKYIDGSYLFYALQDNILKNKIKARATGTTVIGIKSAELKKVEIDIPNLEEQKKIASILSALDDKIELNQKINENLEQQAQAIFKSWFIDDIENSKKGTFSEIITYLIGGDWGKEQSTGNYKERVYCIRGADIPDIRTGKRGKMPTRFILEKNLNTKKLVNGDIVVEISGGSPTQSTGRVCMISNALLERFNNQMICTNFCRAIKPKDGYSMFIYYYCLYLYNKGIFFLYENGTTGIKNLDISSFIESEPIKIPNFDKIVKFNNLCNTIFSEIYSRAKENEQLTKIRDTLLPKLMNGEIDINIVK